MSRTALLLVLHDLDSPKGRESLSWLLRGGGKSVEVQALDARFLVALIAPSDLEISPVEGGVG